MEPVAQDATGVTPLHLAAIRGHQEVVSLLLNNGCGPEHRDARGDTPMHWAATKVCHVDTLVVALGVEEPRYTDNGFKAWPQGTIHTFLSFKWASRFNGNFK